MVGILGIDVLAKSEEICMVNILEASQKLQLYSFIWYGWL